ncbi:ImmA/IrrE family metallo-endopeptidase [Sediminibacillus halophilus]|uniref:IrrE N-terminal-like domain-containing protein n=1 Tax=Sediminibacillus halophilus TaxID=482461 RepID=A0A1G9QXH2_9BACI|nr:ImmA/IrrE family metallo-endopeptidase [Sediminibacillus halophilus]SDM15718.1 protein of unknown function [Sediminibacillus halophilus]
MYEQLLAEADALNIEVLEMDLKPRTKGLYGDKVIWLNKNIDTTVEKGCILAEEIGHYHMTVGDILNQSKIMNIKQEKLARKWAFKRIIPLHKFIESFDAGCRSRFEIAEMLNVTESFLEECLDFYRQKHGTEVRVDDKHILFLNPLAVYETIN